MKEKLKKLIFGLVTISLLVLFTGAMVTTSKAFGDFNDYDYGSSSSDWGSSDWGSSDWDSGSSGGGDLGGALFLIEMFFAHPCICSVLAVIGIVIMLIFGSKKKKNGSGGGNVSGSQNRNIGSNNGGERRQAKIPKSMPNRSNEISAIVKAEDEFFTEPDFITYAKDVYMDIQNAWCKRDLSSVQAVLHSNLYDRTQKQLDKKIADGIVPHLDRITVEEAYLTFYKKDAEYEYVTVYLSSKMIDYQTQESTGNILYGDMTTRWELHYLMTFMRSNNVKTPEAGSAKRAFNCPNCGGVMDSINFGTCPYCGSIVKSGEYGWVLSDFNAVRDNTTDQGIQK